MWFSKRSRRLSISFIISLFFGVQILGFFAFPQRANAQFDSAITALFGGKWTWEKAQETLVGAALASVVSGTSYFMRKLAYDTAKYVASGGKGQGALAFQNGFGSYIGEVAADSAASAIQQFTEPLLINFCNPSNAQVQVGLQVGLQKIYDSKYGEGGGPQPECKWDQMKQTFENIKSNYFETDAISERFSKSLNVSETDFGLALGFKSRVENQVLQAQYGAVQERTEGGGFKPVTDIISGNIRTPSQLIKEESSAVTAKNQGNLTSSQVAGMYGSDNLQVLPMALSVFANTLVSSLLENIMDGGLFPSGREGEGASGVADFFASNISYNRQAAEKAFSYLIATVPQRSLDTYELVTEFSACPNTIIPGLNNCVMDGKLAEAVNLARNTLRDNPLTIEEALEKGFLNKNWLLIPPSREADNTNLSYCYSQAYCYSNIQKLRKARILPLGFEIAILKSDPDNPWKLGDVVKGFNDCDSSGRPSPAFPYCHLIDPNWIIKAPEARCEAQVWGPQLQQEGTALRAQECVDFSTCLKENENGQCISYGYCTKEKNIWHMPGDSCPAHYNTCKTYINSVSGSVSSYLSRTLDYGGCSVESKGCRAYSTEQNPDGTWKNSRQVTIADKMWGREQMLYFNDSLSAYPSCPESAEGCSIFRDALTSQNIYLKKAPEYLGCYDTDVGTRPIDWPQTRAGLVALQDRSELCKNFAQVCVRDEVGCEGYTPAQGGIEVPGIATTDNLCSEECIGYETFKQEDSNFEQSQFPLYFIPSQAQTCSAQYVGCDEFTNIDALSGGGETLEYYSNLKYCERPEENNAKVFYTWEGSSSQGFVLRKHTLAQINTSQAQYIAGLGLDALEFVQGSPAYADDSRESLENNYAICNATQYNLHLTNPYAAYTSPDCRAYYDSTGSVYYRLKQDTVTVSIECRPLRKSVSNLFVDTFITEPSLCSQKGGVWDGVNNACSRCFKGGTFQTDLADPTKGACIYYSIKSEADVCPASANGCRSYMGNQGNNKEVHSINFEPNGTDESAMNIAKQGWSGTTAIVAEAIQVGLHSLRVTGDTSYTFDAERIQQGAWYELQFWARGQSQAVSISFTQGGATQGVFTYDVLTRTPVLAPIGNDWQEYRLGPVQFTGTNEGAVSLVFDTNGSASYFIDNVRIVRIGQEKDDYLYLIKDSWKTREGYNVPLSCDSTPLDGFPGEALGCRAYTTRDGQSVALTGFDRLCRVEAIGCKAMVDTYNTVSGENATLSQAYNVLCEQGKNRTVLNSTMDKTICEKSIGNNTYSCTVKRGETSCYIDTAVVIPSNYGSPKYIFDNAIQSGGIDPVLILTDQLRVVTSTIVIPADSNTIYLTHRPEFTCSNEHVGCEKVGLEEQTNPGLESTAYRFFEQHVLNNPDHYSQTLCREDLVGCSEYKQGNNLTYFKDPILLGAKACRYRDLVEIDGVKYRGWFMDSVGVCQNESGVSSANTLCDNDSQCSAQGEICKKDIVPCYQNQLSSGGEFGLLSQGTPGYQGFVGMCGGEDNGCTEFVDPAGTSGNTAGQTYYAIYSDKLFARAGECGGKASQKYGCVLFDMTENPNKTYNSVLTYNESKEKNYDLVSIKTDEAPGFSRDTNVLLKVNRDRECSEWLACKSAITVVNENNTPQSLCQMYESCNQMDESGLCTNWVDARLDNSYLSEEKYISRNVGWGNIEYSGYSLFNKYNPTNYRYILFDGRDEAYLAFVMNSEFFESDADNLSKGCSEMVNSRLVKEDGAVCGFDEGGRCYKQECLYPVDGWFMENPLTVAQEPIETKRIEKNVNNMLSRLEPGICKSYPRQDSPFPIRMAVLDPYAPYDIRTSTIGLDSYRKEYSQKYTKYAQANVCQGSIDEDCSCGYVKVEYKNGTVDYWPYRSQDAAYLTHKGICTGNTETEGSLCNDDSGCGAGGTCSLLKQKGTFYGLKGLCMEYDFSRPIASVKNSTAKNSETFACLSWLPLQISASSVDLFNADVSAGYTNEDGNGIFCLQGTRSGKYFDRNKFNFQGQDITNIYNSFFGTSAEYQQPEKAQWPDGTFIYDSRCDEVFLTNINGASVHSLQDENGVIYVGAPDATNSVQDLENNNCRLFSHDEENKLLYARPVYATGISFSDAASKYVTETSGGTESGELYKAMQTWAWKKTGTNSVVLRLENRVRSNRGTIYLSDKKHGQELGGGSESDKGEVATVTGLVPNPDSTDGLQDLGTFMHPPRTWTTTNNVYYYSLMPDEPWGYEYVSTVSLSPGPDMSENSVVDLNPFANNGLYRAPFEGDIRESDLQKVYFVPIMFPKGMDGENPRLLATDFYIDFNNLRQQKNYGLKRSADRASGGDYNFPTGKSADGIVFNYVLDTTNSDFDTWAHNQYSTDTNISYSNSAISDRNKIARRYVTVFTHQDYNDLEQLNNNKHTAYYLNAVNQFIGSGTLFDEAHDPFNDTHLCDARAKNMLVIGMDFNSKGEFLGYVSRFCHAAVDDNGINFAVIASLNTQCVEYAQVHDETVRLDDTSNKAWTHRVWSGSSIEDHPFSMYRELKKDMPQYPFGALSLSSQFLPTPDNPLLFSYTLRDYSFDDAGSKGVPYACTASWLNLDVLGASGTWCNALLTNDPNPTNGRNYAESLVNGGATDSSGLSDFSEINARKALSNLFARYYRISNTTPAMFTKDATPIDHSGDSFVDISKKRPPQIFSINTFTCSRSGTDCTIGEVNNVTINMKNGTLSDFNGDGKADENKNPGEDNTVDPIIANGSYYASLKFFATADDDRMPIRRVMVNWDDNTRITNQGVTGMYKNRKPFCDFEDGKNGVVGRCTNRSGGIWQEGDPMITCKEDIECKRAFGDDTYSCYVHGLEKKFGDAPRACKPQYFEFSHVYHCFGSDADVEVTEFNRFGSPYYNPEAYSRLLQRNDVPEKVCVFKPGVQVLDNWGWCNGSCSANGCYDNVSGNQGCTNFLAPANVGKPWTLYRGAIIVIP